MLSFTFWNSLHAGIVLQLLPLPDQSLTFLAFVWSRCCCNSAGLFLFTFSCHPRWPQIHSVSAWAVSGRNQRISEPWNTQCHFCTLVVVASPLLVFEAAKSIIIFYLYTHTLAHLNAYRHFLRPPCKPFIPAFLYNGTEKQKTEQ